MTAKYEITVRTESKDEAMKVMRLVTDAGFSASMKVHPAEVESMASEEEVANDLSGANELAAQGLRDLIGAGLVEAVREPNGKIGYRITEFGRGLSKEEADAILRRLDLLDYASDTEH